MNSQESKPDSTSGISHTEGEIIKDAMDKDLDQTSAGQDFTSNDLMKFLQRFQATMETSNVKMQTDLERKLELTNEKIDTRLNSIDKDINELKIKASNDEILNKRMEDRLQTLENEMNKSRELRRKTEQLKNNLTEQTMNTVTPVGRTESGNRVWEDTHKKQGFGEMERRLNVKNVNTEIARKNELKTHEQNKHKGAEEIEGDLRSSFRSDWAKAMQEDLEQAAKEKSGDRVKQREDLRVMHNQQRAQETSQRVQPGGRPTEETRTGWEEEDRAEQHEIPDRWEELIPKRQTTKVRRPPSFRNWFGMESETSDSSDDTLGNEWNEVERGRKNEKKKVLQRKKRKETMRLTALKASHMVGIGPVDRKLLEARRREGETYERAKEMAVKDLLAEELEYEYDELIELSLEETRFGDERGQHDLHGIVQHGACEGDTREEGRIEK